MAKLFVSISTVLLTISLSSQSAELTLTTDDGLSLKTDFFQSTKTSDRAVLMLHQCNYNRSMYDEIGKQLAQKGIHALSLDFRGFGESVTNEFDVEKIQTLPQDKRGEAWRNMSTHWPKDVELAYNHLKNKMSKDGVVGVIGASCGGSQAITLAENNPIEAMSFFSSGQREENINRYKKALADKPTLIIAAEADGGTFTSAQQLFKVTTNDYSKFISYKGEDHGYPLLSKDKHLATTIVNWFDSQLD